MSVYHAAAVLLFGDARAGNGIRNVVPVGQTDERTDAGMEGGGRGYYGGLAADLLIHFSQRHRRLSESTRGKDFFLRRRHYLSWVRRGSGEGGKDL